MFGRQVDPASLDGDELTRWYQRSPWDVEQERLATAAQRYAAFFGKTGQPDPDPRFSRELGPSQEMVDPGFDRGPKFPAKDIDPGFSSIPPDQNRWRGARLPTEQAKSWESPSYKATAPASRETGSADQRRLLASNRPVGARPGAARTSVSAPDNKPVGATRSPTTTVGYRTPATPPPPSFFSSLFGGPAPLTSPEGNVVGYYDHQAGKAGLGLTAQYSAVAPLFHPAGWMDALLAKGGQAVSNAVRQGIEEALHNHHPHPLFMGGAANQELAALRQSLHQNFHSALRSTLKEAGFPNVGGRGGAARDWARYFRLNPGSYDKAIQTLQQVSRDFDKANGTSISEFLEKELARIARNGGQK